MAEPAGIEALLRRRPPAEALEWVTSAFGRGAKVASIRRLRGGDSSAVHAVDLDSPGGVRHRLVLRRFVRADWLAREPDLARQEAHVLGLIESARLPAPHLVAVDPDGTTCDVPAVLMTRLPGRVEFAPKDLRSWLSQLAAVLPEVHALPVGEPEKIQPYRTYNDISRLEPPRWSHRIESWQHAIDILARPAPETASVFIHRDYHPGNVLWFRGRLSGVIDWINASWGPPGIDVGHCRLNLVQMHGLDAADRFLAVYERASSARQHPYWDLLSLIEVLPRARVYPPWLDGGLHDLTPQLVHARLDDYVASLVAKL